MLVLNQLNAPMDVCMFVVWCLAVWAVAQVLFRSFAAQELRSFMWRPQRQLPEVGRIIWELNERVAWNPRIEAKDPLFKPTRLTADDIADRQNRLRKLKKDTVLVRMGTYLLRCVFCQNIWASLLLLLVYSSWQAFAGDVVPSVLAYAGLTTIITAPFTATVAGQSPRPQRGTKTSCSG